MNGMQLMKTGQYLCIELCCLISNFEAFRLLNLEALLLIKKLLIKKLGVYIYIVIII